MLDLTCWLLVFIRATALLAVFPIFSMANIPVMVRLALGALLAWLISPLLPPVHVGEGLWSLIGAILAEGSVGLLLGFVGRLVFSTMDMVGSILTTEIGLSAPAGMNPLTGTQTSEVGTILNYLAGIIFLSLNLHHNLIVAFQRSYHFVPIGGVHLSRSLLFEVVGRTSQLFVLAVQMAAPLIAVSFIITLVLAVLSRAVPTMNVFAESFGIRLLVGMIVFGMTCQLLAQHIMNALQRLPEDLLHIAFWLGYH